MRKDRNLGLDITRIIAFISVPSVHFFLNSGFYDTPVLGEKMYVMVILRTLFMICVPLFMLLSGYLMSEQRILMNKKSLWNQYKKLSKVLITYILATALILIYRGVGLHEQLSLKSCISNILGFNQYSWYVEMYIGFFLLIPFLNCLWHNIQKDGREILVLVVIVLTTIPSILNIWDFETPKALISPWISTNYKTIVPDWWVILYPITYYYIGAYIKCYIDIKKLRTWKLAVLLVFAVSIFGLFNIWRSYSVKFVWGPWCGWGGFQNVIDTVLIFLIINSIDYQKVNEKIASFLAVISNLTFGAYILSWIPDTNNYPKLKELEPIMQSRLKYFPIIVGKTIIIALILSLIIFFCIKIIKKLFLNLRKKVYNS